MPVSLIPTFLIYCFVTAITPGPANLCSLASAMAYGRKQALIQWRGLFTGYSIVAFVSSLAVWFLGVVVDKYIYVLTWIGAAYIIWLAWHIMRSDNTNQAQAGKHCNFYTGLLVQLTNAKIMVCCITALTTYALPYADSYWDVFKIAALLPFLGGPVANLVWLFAGAGMQRFFVKYQKPVNIVMAISLVICAVSIVMN